MADVHHLIVSRGIEEARQSAITKHDRRLVEAAYSVLSEETDRLGFTHAGFALTSLPHKATREDVWRKEGHNLTLLVETGRDRQGKAVGIPYGSLARLILLYLQTEAIRTNSPEVELGRSMRVWLGSMGLSIGGATYKLVSEQARRISACRLTFLADSGAMELRRNGAFVDTAISVRDIIGDQPRLWQDTVVLNAEFYRSLKEHPVPVSEAALRAIGTRSAALDVYIWLCYRLHALSARKPITWAALYSQFGGGFKLQRKFRGHFIECLQIALAAYPDAQVTVDERGIVLHPSRPAVGKL